MKTTVHSFIHSFVLGYTIITRVNKYSISDDPPRLGDWTKPRWVVDGGGGRRMILGNL